MCLVEKSKTNLVIFSIVLAIFSTFFCSNVNATYTNTFYVNDNSNYVSFLENSTTYFDRLNEIIDGLQYLTTNYDIIIFTGSSFDYNTNIYLFEKNNSIDYGIYYYKNGSDVVFQSYLLNPNTISVKYYNTSFKLKTSNFSANSVIDNIEQYMNSTSNIRSTNKSFHDIWRGTISSNYLPYYSSIEITYGTNGYTGNTSYEKLSYSYDNDYITNGDKYMTYYDYTNKKSLNFKKSGSYSYLDDNMGSLKYLDLYFNKEDFNKEIDFSLIYNDYNNNVSCGFNCDIASILGFDITYLLKDDNNMYKWVKNNQIGVSLDIDEIPENTGSGFILNSKILLKFDDTIFTNIEQVKVSINFNSAFNFSYEYYDNSNITAENIDEYYSVMLGQNGRLYRTKQYDKYAILSTTNDKIKENIVIEYVNTDKHLYVEYFDVSNASYINNGLLSSASNYTFNERQLEKYSFEIGTKNKRGLYLMNYLYHKDDKNENSYYYYYLPLDISLYNTDYLDEALFYDNNNSLISGIISNPDYETDNINFIDNFRPFFQLNEDLEQTRIFFNDAFNTIYSKLPLMIKVVMQLICHILCIAVLLEMLGWGDY